MFESRMPSIEKVGRSVATLAAIGVLIPLAGSAFSWRSKNQIKERDKDKMKKGKRYEAAHVDHNRKNPQYDDPSNGRMLSTPDHYMDHYNRHARNGLPDHQNK